MICGIDLGSREVKLVLFKEDKVCQMVKYDTAKFYRRYAKRENEKLIVEFEKLGFLGDQTKIFKGKIVATGYGRNNISVHKAKVIPEIKAHTYGVISQTGLVDFTMLDLGGQDSKVVLVRDGQIKDFQMNDKCAASSGRYLENMAKVLGVSLKKMSQYYQDPVSLNTTCAIFGESELIGKMIAGYSMERLCAAVNYSVLKRVLPFLNKFNSEKLVLCGGVAKNSAIKHLIEEKTTFEVVIPPYPQYNAALGCAFSYSFL